MTGIVPRDVPELLLLRREVREVYEMHGRLNELREQRISAIEEIFAAPWPRRWFLAWRFGRELRRSARQYAWAGDSWHERRAHAMSDQFYVTIISMPVRKG